MPQGPASEPSAPLVARNVLHTERVRNTFLIDKTRFVGVLCFAAVCVFFSIVDRGGGWRAMLPYFLPYAALSGGLYALARQRTLPSRYAGLVIALCDIPIVFFLQRASLMSSPSPGGVAGFTLGVFALLVVVASKCQDIVQVSIAAGVAAALEIILQVEAGVQIGAMVSAVLVFWLLALVCRHTISRSVAMAQQIDADIAAREKIESEQKDMRARLSQSDRLAALGTLAASVAHEINNPLAYILGNLDLMAENLRALEPGGGNTLWQEIAEGVRESLDQLDRVLKATYEDMPSKVRHDLRNVLTPVYVHLDTLAENLGRLQGSLANGEDSASNDLRSMLQKARDGGERLRLITRNLKSMSRSDDTAVGPLQFEDVIESCVSMAEAEIKHHARLVRAFEKVPDVDGNHVLLGQVLLNLLINAAQAIPDGHPEENTITVGTSIDVDGFVAAYVRDTGPGIPTAVRARIFEPFFTTKPVGVGTGLGLSICRSIVESLQGNIEVHSEVGRGSTFKVVLPPSRGTPLAAPAPQLADIPSKGRARVMVIDDEVMIGEVLRQVLERDHIVSVFTNARQALERLKEGSDVDVILCDLTMPLMPASDFYKELTRMDPALADKVIFTTGGAFVASNQAFLRTIPNQCLEKPFDIPLLRQAVQNFLR